MKTTTEDWNEINRQCCQTMIDIDFVHYCCTAVSLFLAMCEIGSCFWGTSSLCFPSSLTFPPLPVLSCIPIPPSQNLAGPAAEP